MRFKLSITRTTLLMICFNMFLYNLFIILIPLLLLYWLSMSVYNWFLNKFNLDRSADKIRITEIDQQCLNAIEELNKVNNKDWLKKYTLLFHAVYIQHTGPSRNHILNTYRGKEYTNITKFVNQFNMQLHRF